MKSFRIFTIILAAVCLSGCYDDAKLQEDIADLQKRVSTLEVLCSQMNNNIVGMQTIINVLNNNDYITAVTPVMIGDKEVGYTITFLKSAPITIYHGENGTDGQDGSTPVVGLREDTDGNWYWTVNGEWLLDEQGMKVRANGIQGEKGDDGQPGIAPQLKIEEGYWYISTDNGSTWTKLEKATGEDGKDGTTPIIGLKQDTDGVWYWTIGNEWLLDDEGNKVRASGIQGDKGNDGTPGITPQLQISDGYWYISMNNGVTWTKLGKATGEDGKDGDSMFLSVTYDDKYAYFTLVNGTVLTIPLSTNIPKLQFTLDKEKDIHLSGGGSVVLNYTITSPTGAQTSFTSYESNNWKVVIQKTSATNGTITITAPNPVESGKIMLVLSDDFGNVFVKTLEIIGDDNIIRIIKTEYTIDEFGGYIDVAVDANLGFSVQILDGGDEWISTVTTGATTRLSVLPNPDYSSRTATVRFKGNDGETSKDITITQLQNNAIVVTSNQVNLTETAQIYNLVVRANIDCIITIPSDISWISDITTKALIDKTFNLSITENEDYDPRSAVVIVQDASGKIKQSITITQAGYTPVYIEIPDATFLSYLVETCDINGDGKIDKKEASKVTSINCSSRAIESLSGIENFINLTTLDCSKTQITSLDISVNTKLTSIRCQYNESMVSLALPKINSISNRAFVSCTALKDLELPETITSVGTDAFLNCSAMKSLIVNSDINTTYSQSFSGAGIQDFTIHGKASKVPADMFRGSSFLQTVTIGENIKTLGTYAFADCIALSKVTFDKYSKLTKIQTGCFRNCDNLYRLDMTNCTELGSIEGSSSLPPFYGHTSSLGIYLGTRVPPGLGYQVYRTYNSGNTTCFKVTVRVPSDCISAYKNNSYWYNSNYVTITSL